MPDPNKGAAIAEKPKPVVNGKPRAAKKKEPEREVLYPMITVTICGTPENTGVSDELAEAVRVALEKIAPNLIGYSDPITAADAMRLLGWEAETEYVKRRRAEDPNLKESKLMYASDFMLKDKAGNKIRCSNNIGNRPFDEKHSRKLAQDILSREFKLNCENIIISRTGQVISGQHRLIGLILAVEEYYKQDHWKKLWPEGEPYIETLIVFGGSDDPAVLQTIDNVKPRQLYDIFFTSPLFANKSTGDRKEMSRMMDYAVDLLWKRLRATEGGFIEHQTHSASLDLYDRHKKVEACVKHIHDEDGGGEGRAISNLGINSGHAAALCYLMSQSATTPDTAEQYYNSGKEKNERRLDFKHWDKALAFWSEIAKNPEAEKAQDRPAPWVQVVRDALAGLNDPDSGRGATTREQHAVLAMAWAKYILKESFEPFDEKKHRPMMKNQHSLYPAFSVDKDTNKRKMDEEPLFGGIDRGTLPDEGDPNAGASDNPSAEDIAAGTLDAQKKRAEKLEATLNDKTKTTIVQNPNKKVLPIPTPADSGEEAPDLDDMDPSDEELKAVEQPKKVAAKKPVAAPLKKVPAKK